MTSASIRFYAELNEFLPQEKRHVPVDVPVDGLRSVRAIILSCGVPGGEVDLVLANGISVDLNYPVRENDRISVYPVFETFDISGVTRVREHPLREPAFILDCHLGKLAYYLRMLGFDTLYRSDFRDDELVTLSNHEHRTLLSRDRKLIGEGAITRGYRVEGIDPELQVVEVLKRFDLFTSVRPLQRCLRCNTFLVPAEKEVLSSSLLAVDRFQTLPPSTSFHQQSPLSSNAHSRSRWDTN